MANSIRIHQSLNHKESINKLMLLVIVCGLLHASAAAGTPKVRHYSDDPLQIEITGTEADVLAAVQEVVNDDVVHGTYSYEHDKTLRGAKPAEQSSIFEPWSAGGHVFYKIAENVITPRHFKDTEAIGTLAVRYVVIGVDAQTTRVQIEATYLEASHKELHPSDGSVEVAEFGAIRERLDKIVARRNAPSPPSPNESSSKASEEVAESALESHSAAVVPPPAKPVPFDSVHDMEAKVAQLRSQVEATITSNDAQLKAAPYKTAANVAALPRSSKVAVLIVTKYWYGIETAEGQHGWIHRSQVEFAQ